MNIIAVDIGNSTISIGISGGIGIDVYRLATHPLMDAQGYLSQLCGFLDMSRLATVSESVICSVVPEATGPMVDALVEMTAREAMAVTSATDCGFILDIENLETIGVDRIASAAGALSLAQPPLAIIDFGTATTVNFVDPAEDGKPVFKSGAILPGMDLMSYSLENRAAKLPRVATSGVVKLPGRNTQENILAGITYATAGGVERIIEEVEASTGLNYRVMVTGGMHELAATYIRRPTKRQPALALRGLLSIYGRAQGGRGL